MKAQEESTTKLTKPYVGPLIVAVGGTIVPLSIGFVAAILARRPQCPAGVTQAQIDSGSCIIGADMSFILVFMAVPFVALSLLIAVIWAGVIWHKIHPRHPH